METPDREQHRVEVGDEILIDGYLFVVTELKVQMNQPPTLVTKSPLELMGYKVIGEET